MQQKIRVLVSGINYAPNQFTRQVEAYGCEAIHVKGDPGANFPRFADAAIIVSSYTSHANYYEVKAAYKSQNKPIFLTALGFSQIKEGFESFLKSKRGYVIPPETFVAGQLTVPSTWLDQKTKAMVVEIETPVSASQPEPLKTVEEKVAHKEWRYSDEQKEKIYELIKRGATIGQNYTEIANAMNNKGLRNLAGKEFQAHDVANFKTQMRSAGLLEPSSYGREKALESKVAAPKSKPVMEQKFDKMTMIQLVSGAKELSPQDRIDIIQRITLGEITQPEHTEVATVDGVLILEKTSIYKPKDQGTTIHLSKEQADLLLSNIAALHQFTQGGV